MTKIQTPFGFSSTGDEVIDGVDLRGRRAIVTDAASAVGVETARVLAAAGADVTLAVRRLEAGEKIASAIARSTGNPAVRAAALDLSEQASVWEFANAWSGPLNILVNNAERMAPPELRRTVEGWELQFATNYLGHFALTLGLHAALKAAHGARVVSLSSSASLFSPVLFGDPHFNFMPYTPFVARGQSKTAQALFAVAVTQRWSHEGIFANSLSPGAIATHRLIRSGGLEIPVGRLKTVAQGVATSILLAASPLLEGIGGRYFEDCNEASVLSSRPTDLCGVAPYALDPPSAHALWELSLALVHRP